MSAAISVTAAAPIGTSRGGRLVQSVRPFGRLLVIAIGGWICVHVVQTGASGLFAVVAVSLAVYGLTIAAAIRLGNWAR